MIKSHATGPLNPVGAFCTMFQQLFFVFLVSLLVIGFFADVFLQNKYKLRGKTNLAEVGEPEKNLKYLEKIAFGLYVYKKLTIV